MKKEILWKSGVAVGLHYAILVAASLIPFGYSISYQHMTGTWMDHFLQWDGVWYGLIGKYGYHLPAQAQQILYQLGNQIPVSPVKATGFFPFLPMLIHVLGMTGTLVVTNSIFAVNVVLFSLWLSRTHLSVGWGAVLFALNPAAMFESFIYPGAYLVFFALAVMMLTRSKTRWWWLAAILGYLSSLTAGLGAIIGIFVMSFFQRKEWVRGVIYGLSVAMGWTTFALVLISQKVPALAFLHAEKLWGRVWRFPMAAWLGQFHESLFIGHWDQVFVALYVVLLVAFVANWIRSRHVPVSDFSWGVAYTVFCLSTYWIPYPLVGDLRFIADAVPLYGIVPRTDGQGTAGQGIHGLAAILLVVFVAAFAFGSLLVTHGGVYQ